MLLLLAVVVFLINYVVSLYFNMFRLFARLVKYLICHSSLSIISIMLTLFGKALSFATGSGVVTDPTVNKQSSSDSSDVEEEEENKEFSGNVVLVNENEGYGLVSDNIYFDFGVICGGVIPKVGSTVSGKAVRKCQTDSWKATRLLVLNELWEDVPPSIEQTVSKPVTVGIVTACAHGVIVVNDGLNFNLQDLTSSFDVTVGDMVMIERSERNGVVCIEIKPLMERRMDAEVTLVKEDWGVIHNEIWFSFTACRNGYSPRRGDSVSVIAVESQQGKNQWRATLVTPKYPITHSRSLPPLKFPTQNFFLKQLLSNKNGIEISNPLDFGVLVVEEEKFITAWITNASDVGHVLVSCNFQASDSCPFTVGRPKHPKMGGVANSPVGDKELCIAPKEMVYFNIVCCHSIAGNIRNLLIFTFEGFTIGRYVEAKIHHPHQQSLMPSAPFNKKETSVPFYSRFNRRSEVIIPGERPSRPSLRFIPVQLPQYPIPERLWNCLMEKDDLLNLLPSLKENLSRANYENYFSALLHLEEIQMTLDMRQFDMIEVCLHPKREYLSLFVPGLAEGRPSLLIGDKVYLRVPESQETNGPVYEGYIHEVLKEEVLVKFNSSFHSEYAGETYNASFAFNRTPLRRCHLAVRQVDKIDSEVLFPSKRQTKPPQIYLCNSEADRQKTTEIKKAISLCWFNNNLNERQKSAVKNIICGYCRPLPYIIFGPPGTGKTVTVVEAILQIFTHISCSRILVCTPSNSAADLIVERLDKSGILNSGHLVRLNAFQRRDEMISESVKPYCLIEDDPQLIIRRRIVVTTCTTSGTLYAMKLQTKHFSHLFVDEAGQATEPESMVALNLVSLGEGQVVLAGDPLQLGPILRSEWSKFYGLQVSLLARLMQRMLYARDETLFADHGNYDSFLVTKLVCNYRSHPSILKLFSDLFYHSELINCASWDLVGRFDGSSLLPNPNFPMILHSVQGENYREANSPSWFNPAEVCVAVKYLKDLYQIGLRPSDVGIITPYRKQVEKMRLLITTLDLEPCKVGSVEEFQGQERLVVILSTVRSCDDLVDVDVKHNIGFLSNSERFNVAISRAQALLIVVGNSSVLVKDANWKKLVDYCKENAAYLGT